MAGTNLVPVKYRNLPWAGDVDAAFARQNRAARNARIRAKEAEENRTSRKTILVESTEITAATVTGAVIDAAAPGDVKPSGLLGVLLWGIGLFTRKPALSRAGAVMTAPALRDATMAGFESATSSE